ncbi:MAG TPA: DUF6152 family protein [Steroidobacteraceae bacterium]|jgi:hypothetical protein|nr:DUF6152 family protein [Steroidobacteraceae bacterium]
MIVRRLFRVALIAAALGSALAAPPLFAHHSFGLYDMGRTSQIDGIVAQMEWSNPHCWLFVQVGNAGAALTGYGFEMTSVGEMTRRGWKRNAVKAGDKVKVRYHPLRDGRTGGLMMAVITADGRPIGRIPAGTNPPNSGPPP